MKRIVTLGGGTGTFVVLSGLRDVPELALSAIVTSADDGGSTGRLRDAYGFLPPGDVRQALVALAEEGNVLRDLFAYRFEKGDIAGHSLGNLFLTALADLTGGGAKALEEASKILRITGTVIPATEEPATLRACFESGTVMTGQNAVSEAGVLHGRISECSYEKPLPLTRAAKQAIEEADFIVLGPGCLYSSTIASMLADGTKDALMRAKGKIMYIANLFTKKGETDGFTVRDHVEEVTRYAGREPDSVFVHEGVFTPEVLAWYAAEGEYPLTDDLGDDPRVRRLELASAYVVPPLAGDPLRRSLMRHDSAKLARALVNVCI